MQPFSPEGLEIIDELARRYSVSPQAVTTLLQAVISGNGTMAQFTHPELGGPGQWSQGGMTMVGDMFNNALKAKVDGLCSDLARLVQRETSPIPPSRSSQTQSQGRRGGYGDVSLFISTAGGSPGDWWGEDLGAASATGSQNNIRYAYFPASRRLAVAVGGHLTIYDTADHVIAGVSQQQSGDASLSFVSQRGLIRVADLRVVSNRDTIGSSATPASPASAPEPTARREPQLSAAVKQPASVPSRQTQTQPEDIFSKLERLADLRTKGVISAEEFAAKKAELLGRI